MKDLVFPATGFWYPKATPKLHVFRLGGADEVEVVVTVVVSVVIVVEVVSEVVVIVTVLITSGRVDVSMTVL